MTTNLGDVELERLSAFVAATTGLHFPPGRWGDLERQMNSAAEEFGFADTRAFIQRMLSSPLSQSQVEMLAAHLTISETYFWREPKTFEALRDTILPELIRARTTGARALRLWCAGCSTGEEAYSIAFVLRDLVSAHADWHITLLATDINPHILQRAARGLYADRSFRNAPPGLREKYFYRRNDGKFEVLPEIRKMVTFAYLNLAEDTYPSLVTNTHAMDVIFCRNVLMYFVKERAQQAVQRFSQALTEGGWLMVAAAELSQERFPQFTSVGFPGAFVYRRLSPPSSAAGTVPSPALAASVPVQPPAPPAASPPATKPLPALPTGRAEPPDQVLGVRHLANQGKLPEALAACVRAIADNKLDPALHYLHAIILSEENLDSEAKAALKRTLYLDPEFVLAHFTLGKLALRQGNAPAARKSLNNALALLSGFAQNDILPEAEGLTAGRLSEIVRATLQTGALTL